MQAARPSQTHPRPSVAEAIERGKMRHAADWLAFFVGLALLLAIGLAAGLRHRATGEALPPPPPALR